MNEARRLVDESLSVLNSTMLETIYKRYGSRTDSTCELWLSYHNVDHAHDVANFAAAASEYYVHQGLLEPRDTLLAYTAGIYHDCQQKATHVSNEQAAVNEFLLDAEKYSLSSPDKEKITAMILATRVRHQGTQLTQLVDLDGEPSTVLLQQCIADGDLSSFGAQTGAQQSVLLFIERQEEIRTINDLGKKVDFEELTRWLNSQKSYYDNHFWHTSYATQFNHIKALNIVSLQRLSSVISENMTYREVLSLV